MIIRKWRILFSGRALLLAMCFMVAACEPAPEERMARAEAYAAAADYRSAILELKNALRAAPDYAAARLLLAQASYQLGDLATAEIEYERALALGEDRPEVWVSFGRTLLEQRKAQDAFERVVPNLVSRDEAALVLQGDILASLGNTNDANVAYLAALERNPSSAGGLIGRAALAAGAADHQGALAFLDAAIEGNPNAPLVWRAKGNYLRTLRDFSGAAEAFAKSMLQETRTTALAGRFSTRVNRVSVLIDARDYAAASAQFDELSAGFPVHPVLRYLRGRIAFGNGDYALAQAELQEYLALVPRDARGQAILGAVNFSQDYLRQAEMYLMQAVRAKVGGESARRLLAETQLRLNKPEQALAVLQAAQAQGQSDPMLLAMLARAEIGLGDTESAINYYAQSAAADPGNPAARLSLAATYMQVDRVEDAIKVLESMPDMPGSRYRRETLLMGAYLRADRPDQAIQQGDEVLTTYPNDAAALALVGVLHTTLGNKKRAAALFGQALDLDPQNLGALYNLATMAVAAGDMPAAADRFARLLDAHPAHVPGLVFLASVLEQQGNLGRIRPRLTAAIKRAPESIAARVLLARVELAAGQYDAAHGVLTETRELFPDEPGLDHLEGVILVRKGQLEEALRSLARAVAAFPDNARYIHDLAATRQMAGDIELSNGAPQAALAHYAAAASNEWTRAAAIKLARANLAAGTGKGADSLERWLAENPNDTGVRLMNAQLLEANGEIDRAVAEYEILYASNQLNAVGLNNLAWQYSLRGRSDAAELALQAHELDPDNGSITDTLAWILFNTGETDRAVGLLRQAVQQSPDNLEIQFHLATVLAAIGETMEAKSIVDELLAPGASFPSRAQTQQLGKTLKKNEYDI